jgi:hypothetical protein
MSVVGVPGTIELELENHTRFGYGLEIKMARILKRRDFAR